MKNTFTIVNPENTLLISIQWEMELPEEEKKKAREMVLTALNLWDSKGLTLKEIENLMKSKV